MVGADDALKIFFGEIDNENATNNFLAESIS